MPTSVVRFILSDRCAAPTKIATPCYECLFVVCFLRFAWPRRRASASGASAYPRGKNRLPASAHWAWTNFVGNPKIRTHLPFAVRALPPFRPVISARFVSSKIELY